MFCIHIKISCRNTRKGNFENVTLPLDSINCTGLHFSSLSHCFPRDRCNARTGAKYLQPSPFPLFWLVHTPLRSVHTKLKEAISLGFSEYRKHEIYSTCQQNSLFSSRIHYVVPGCGLGVKAGKRDSRDLASFPKNCSVWKFHCLSLRFVK